MSARTTTQRAALVALATIAALTGGLALMASPGFGFGGYRTLVSAEFGTAGSGNGQFAETSGIAVEDSTGDVYVLDQGNNRVEKFDANGNYISQFTGVETPAKSFSRLTSIAVDNSCAVYKLTNSECAEFYPSAGHIYVTDTGHSVVDVFDSTGKYLSQITGPSPSTPFTPEELKAVAVDPTGGLWVAELTNIMHFSSSGEFRSAFPAQGYIMLNGLAVDGEEDLYAAEYNGGIKKVSAAGEPLVPSLARGHAIAVNKLTNNVIVDSNPYMIEFGPFAKTPKAIIQEFGGDRDGEGAGIAVNDLTQTVYASYKDTVSIYPEAVPPKVLSSPATEPRRSTAAVTAHVQSEGSDMRVRIDYGETSNYGQHSLEFNIAASNNEATIPLGLEGLAPGRTYHYAVQASNTAGTTIGPDGTFKTTEATPPTAATGGASNVTLTTATVSGTIDPEGLETSYELDFGTDTTYGTSIYGEAGAVSEPTELSVPLQNLAPGATYHYRIVAINSDGRTYGADQTFTTLAYSAPIVLPSALPLLQTPTIAFPAEQGAPVIKKKGAKAKKAKRKANKTKRKANKTKHHGSNKHKKK